MPISLPYKKIRLVSAWIPAIRAPIIASVKEAGIGSPTEPQGKCVYVCGGGVCVCVRV